MEAQSERVRIAYTVFARSAPFCMLSRCSLTKFLHRSSGGSLLRVRCWLGTRHFSYFFYLERSLLAVEKKGWDMNEPPCSLSSPGMDSELWRNS